MSALSRSRSHCMHKVGTSTELQVLSTWVRHRLPNPCRQPAGRRRPNLLVRAPEEAWVYTGTRSVVDMHLQGHPPVGEFGAMHREPTRRGGSPSIARAVLRDPC